MIKKKRDWFQLENMIFFHVKQGESNLFLLRPKIGLAKFVRDFLFSFLRCWYFILRAPREGTTCLSNKDYGIKFLSCNFIYWLNESNFCQKFFFFVQKKHVQQKIQISWKVLIPWKFEWSQNIDNQIVNHTSLLRKWNFNLFLWNGPKNKKWEKKHEFLSFFFENHHNSTSKKPIIFLKQVLIIYGLILLIYKGFVTEFLRNKISIFFLSFFWKRQFWKKKLKFYFSRIQWQNMNRPTKYQKNWSMGYQNLFQIYDLFLRSRDMVVFRQKICVFLLFWEFFFLFFDFFSK